MQGKRLWKGTSSQGADGSWLQKAEGSVGPDQTFYPKNAATTGGTPAASLWYQEPRCQGTDGDHHRGLKASESPAPRCPCGLSRCWHLLLGRGLEVGNG